jgi:hypothetical protein
MNSIKLLLVSVFGPFGVRDDYAEGNGMQMELFNNQITRQQGVHSPRQSYWSFPLYLLAENISVPATVLDFPIWEEFTRELEKGYTHVGITFIVPNILKARRMAEHIRSKHPEIKIILGGFGTMVPALETIVPHDSACDGEGVEWLRRYFGEDPSAPIVHPAIFGPAYEYIYGARIPTKGSILLTGVGCNNACEFCATSFKYGKTYVPFLSIGAQVFDACLKSEKELGSRGFTIIDENFLKKPQRARELLAQLEAQEKAYVFDIFSSAEVITDVGIDFLVRLGIHVIWIGVESKANTYTKLKDIDIGKLIAQLQENGISVITSGILFLDHHDQKTIREDIEWIIGLGSDMTQFMNYTHSPCTGLYARLAGEGRLKDIHFRFHHGAGELNWNHPYIVDPKEQASLLKGAFRKKYEDGGPGVLNMAMTAVRGYAKAEADQTRREAESLVWNPMSLHYEKSDHPADDVFMRRRIRRLQKIAMNLRPVLLPALVFAPNRAARRKAREAMRLYGRVLGRVGAGVILKGIFLVFTGFMEQVKLWFRRASGYEDIVLQPPSRRVEYRIPRSG